MASTRERVRSDGSVAYIVRFRHKGEETSETFDSDAMRQRFIGWLDRLGADAARELLDEMDANRRVAHETLCSFARQVVDERTGLVDSTRKKYRAFIRNDLAEMDIPIDAVTPAVVAKWVNRMEKSGASGKTIANKHGFLAGIMEEAVRRRLVEHNPCRDTRLPRTVRTEMTFLTPGEFAVLIGYVPPYWQPLVTLLASTGLRWSEATALACGSVDLSHRGDVDDPNTLTVIRAWKKGDNGWYLGATKTRRSERTVALAPETSDLLRPLVESRQPGDLVFTTRHGGPIRHNTFHGEVWLPAVRLANGEAPTTRKRIRRGQFSGIEPAQAPLGKRPRIHDLRHTAASWLIAQGLDLLTVQYQLGHESLLTTSDRYGHLLPSRRNAAAAAMSRMLTQAFPQIEKD